MKILSLNQKVITRLLLFSCFSGIAVSYAFSIINTSVNAQTRLTEESRVSIYGIGSIRAGMTLEEASRAAGTRLIQVNSGGEDGGCFYYEPEGGPEGVKFMVIDGKIARVDIYDNQNIKTVSKVGIGDSEEKIFSIYSGKIQVTRHTYVGEPPNNGKYLTYMPQDYVDRNYRVVFETSKNKVTNFRSGKMPEVVYIEGCL